MSVHSSILPGIVRHGLHALIYTFIACELFIDGKCLAALLSLRALIN